MLLLDRRSSAGKLADTGLVTPPAVERRLGRQTPLTSGRQDALAREEPDSWLLGVHGGAGVTSLLRAGVTAMDAGGNWPSSGEVLAVSRRSAYGLEWARDTARQHASGDVPDGVELAGLVVVADAPGQTPRRIARFLDLICGAYPRVWEVPWVEEWRLAGHLEPLPTPPSVRQLREDMQALTGAGTDRARE